MRGVLLAGAIMLVAGSTFSMAQTAPPPASQTDIRASQKIAKRAAWAEKKAECRQAGIAQGLTRIDLRYHVRICVKEAKLACIKQAAEQKLRGPERRQFMTRCPDTV